MIEMTMKSAAVKDHLVSKKIETKEDWERAKALAAEITAWWDVENGSFKEGHYEHGYAIHAAQVWLPEHGEVPFNFFVLDKRLTQKQAAKDTAKKDRQARDIKNRLFPGQVIFNAEIVTALQTFLDPLPDKKGIMRKVAVPNVMRYDEACMSYRLRGPRKVSRFYKIKVRYQYVKERMLLGPKVVTVEEWCTGLKAHILQHEIDHAAGVDIHFGNAEGKHPTIEDREREDGYTRKEVEEFTAKKIEEIEAKVQEKGVCILQSKENGRFYRAPTDLAELPAGFAEPDLIEMYDHEGNIKPPHDTVPWYTDESSTWAFPEWRISKVMKGAHAKDL